MQVAVTEYVRVRDEDAIARLHHRLRFAPKIDNQLALPSHWKLPSLTPSDPRSSKMSPLISIGNPNPYINRRPSSHTGYCITISGMLVHKTLVARNGWGSAINQ